MTNPAAPVPNTELKELLEDLEHRAIDWEEIDPEADPSEEEYARDRLLASRSAVEALFGRVLSENERLLRFESYVCGAIAMGTQADLTVESLPR